MSAIEFIAVFGMQVVNIVCIFVTQTRVEENELYQNTMLQQIIRKFDKQLKGLIIHQKRSESNLKEKAGE